MANGSAVWIDVLPAVNQLGPRMTRGATAAARTAGTAAGRQFSSSLAAGAQGGAGANALVTQLKESQARVEAIISKERANIVKARGDERVATANVAAAERRLQEVRARSGAMSSQALRQEAALLQAQNRAQASSARLVSTTDQLAAASRERRVLVGQIAEAQTAATGTTSRMSTAFEQQAAIGGRLSTGLGRMGVGLQNIARNALATLKPLAGMAAGFGAIVGVSKVIELGNQYTKTMNELQAVAGLTNKEMTKVGQTARALGSDLTLPATSGKDAAAIMLELAKGGLTANDAMVAAKGTIQLAAAAQVDGARAAEIQSNSLNQFGLSAKSAGMVADVLANTANAAAGGVDDIATSMKYIGPVSRALGISIGDTASAIGILANNGLKGDTAGTALRGMLASLAAPSDHAAMAIEELGIKAFDSQGNFVGMRSVIDQLSAAQKRMTKENFATYSSIAFGREPLAAVSALASSGATAYDSMTKAVGRQGGAATVAQSQMKGLGGAMDKLESQLEDVALSIYTTITPALTGAVTGIASTLDGAGGKVQHFLDIAGGLGKLAITGKATPAVGGIDPQVIAGVQSARKVLVDSFRDIATFAQTQLVPSLKNIAVAVAPLVAAFGVALVASIRAAAYLLVTVIGPALVAVTGFLRDHKGVVLAAAGAIAYLVLAYKAQQLAIGILNAGGLVNYLRLMPLATLATNSAKRAQEGYALATYGARAAIQAQGVAGAAGVAALYARNLAIKAAAALQFTLVAATKGWTYALMLNRGAAITNATTTTVLTGAQWAFNAALAANPIGLVTAGIILVVAALAALVAGVIYAYKHWTWFRTAVDAVWSGIQVGAKAVGAAAVWLWQTVFVPAWKGIAAAAQWAWSTVLKPAFDGIMSVVRGVGAVFTWWWQNSVSPALRGIASVATWMWNTVSAIFDLAVAILKFTLAPAFTFLSSAATTAWRLIVAGVRAGWSVVSGIFTFGANLIRATLGAAFSWLYTSVVRPVFDWISAKITQQWTGAKIVFAATVAFLRSTLGPAFSWLYNNVIRPVWDGITKYVRAAWELGLKPIFSVIGDFATKTIPRAFDTMSKGIGKAWQFVKDAAKAPIRFVVNTVVNDALIGNFNKVADAFGTKHITPISLPKGFSGGGVLDGYQSAKRDEVLTPMRKGEGVLVPEVVRALGPGFVHSLNAAGNRGGVPGVRNAVGYARGGVLDTGGSKSKAKSKGGSILSGAMDWAKDAASTAFNVVSDPVGTIGKVVGAVLNRIPGAGSMVDLAVGFGKKVLDGAVGSLKKLVSTFLPAGGTGANGSIPAGDLGKAMNYRPGPGVGAMGGYLRRPAAMAWNAMVGASGNALSLTEGYRDLASQQYRWSQYKSGRGNLAAAPGTSVHGFGLAADIGAGQGWARANGPRFGWYPTGLSFSQREPWHFEYKGARGAGMAEGGVLGAVQPTLMDAGGVIPNGISVIENRSKGPEYALPESRLADVVAGASGGGEERDGRLFRDLILAGDGGNTDKQVRDFTRAGRAIKRGGPV